MKGYAHVESTHTSNLQRVNVWLDDLRPEPTGYIRCHTARSCIARLDVLLRCDNVVVDHLSLDHDLGDDEAGTGYSVLTWLEEQVVYGNIKHVPLSMTVHSDNSSARKKMAQAIDSIIRISTFRHE